MSDPRDRASAEAKRDLERLSREGETLGGTAMDAASRGLARDEDDAIEKLGRRIGRGLASSSCRWRSGGSAAAPAGGEASVLTFRP